MYKVKARSEIPGNSCGCGIEVEEAYTESLEEMLDWVVTNAENQPVLSTTYQEILLIMPWCSHTWITAVPYGMNVE